MLALVYLIATTFNEGFAIFPWAPLLADALCTLFFLIGGIALAAYLGVHSCGNQVRALTKFYSSDVELI